ncbi:MAG: methyltransferase domain-containing protein [Gammaproteobacteria bacterium]|nr:methyltransferase domain-containing protein [Gammaproteobacteria bacterium]
MPLACPACGDVEQALEKTFEAITCERCGTRFPVFRSGQAQLPWLLADPRASLLEWKARYNGFLHENAGERARVSDALNENDLSQRTRDRLEHLLHAREQHAAQIAELLAPFGFGRIEFYDDGSPVDRSHMRLAANQGLTSYYQNIFRDWAWNNGENDELLGAVNEVLGDHLDGNAHRLLTVGAGAGRLSLDVHQSCRPELSVAVDINPLLLLIASRMIGGESLSLFEFPVAPLDAECGAVLQHCAAPQSKTLSADDNFQFIFADAMHLPFRPGSFDLLLTPWLIDIIPENLREFAPRMNQTLAQGGIWVNTGSLAFAHSQSAWHYSQDEILDVIEAAGFEILESKRRTLRYLQSPVSAHGRVEMVFSFSARKLRDVAPQSRFRYLPQWLSDTQQAVPARPEHVVVSTDHLLRAQVIAAIDGKRSVASIGRLVAAQYDLPEDEATAAVKRILLEVYENKMR